MKWSAAMARGRLAAALMVLALSSCSTVGNATGGPDGAQGSGVPGSSVSPMPDGSEPQAHATPVPPPLPTGVDDYRSRLGQYADLVLGDALVPYGSVEYATWLKDCLASAGWAVTIRADGTMEVVTGTQYDAFAAAREVCMEAATSIGLIKPLETPDDEFIGAQYDAYQLTYECLSELDYPVAEPPSRDAYIESRALNWDPYGRLSPSQYDAVEDLCPQDLLILFGWLTSGERPWR